MKFTLGSSYYEGGSQFRRTFHSYWLLNNSRMLVRPERTIVISEGGAAAPGDRDTLVLSGNLGHVGQLLSGEKKNEFAGWSASMCALAMLAYCNETDFIYKEEDCLAFGPWVDQMYSDMGSGSMVFGRKHTSAPWMQCSQSLFLVRHAFIPTMVSQYLGLGKDGNKNMLGERKFEVLEERFTKDVVKRLSFGVDRCRPLPFDDKVWYAQQFKQQEVDELVKRRLI